MSTARQRFDAARRAQPQCGVAVMGWGEFDELKREVLLHVADLAPLGHLGISHELDNFKVPHLIYNGVLVMRAYDSATLGPIFL